MQKLIATLVLVLLFVTAAIGQPDYGKKGYSSRSQNWDRSLNEPLLNGYAPPKAYIETSLSFTVPKNPRTRWPWPSWSKWSTRPLHKKYDFSRKHYMLKGMKTHVEAFGREKLQAKQTFELKFSASNDLNNLVPSDHRQIISMSSSPEERIYSLCLRIIGGDAKVKQANPIEPLKPGISDISDIREYGNCMDLELDGVYRGEADPRGPSATFEYAIFSELRKRKI